MKNRFQKGILCLGALLLAISQVMVYPPLSAQAANKSVTVVSKSKDELGGTTVYTYDKKGRLTQTSYTLSESGHSVKPSDAFKKKAASFTGGIVLATPETTASESVGGVGEGLTFAYIAQTDTVTTYTYSDSGKTADKVTRTQTKTTTSYAFAYEGGDGQRNGSYNWVENRASATNYIYNSKGYCTTQLTVSYVPLYPNYTATKGYCLEEGDSFANAIKKNGGDNPYANGSSYVNDIVTLTATTTNTYDKSNRLSKQSKVTVVETHDEVYSGGTKICTNSSKTSPVSESTDWTYNKGGTPTKKAVTSGGLAAVENYADTSGGSGTSRRLQAVSITQGGSGSYTRTYTYNKSGNISKRATKGSLSDITYVLTQTDSKSSDAKLAVLVLQSAGHNQNALDRTSFSTKKMSVSSSRAFAVGVEQWQLKNLL